MNPLALGVAVGLGLLTLAGSRKRETAETVADGKTPAAKRKPSKETAAEAFARGQREATAAATAAATAKAAADKLEAKRVSKLVDRELFRRGVQSTAKTTTVVPDDDDDDDPPPPGKAKEKHQ